MHLVNPQTKFLEHAGQYPKINDHLEAYTLLPYSLWLDRCELINSTSEF